MEIILKQDVENLGHKNEIVSVRPGYANNFLFPNGLAILATVSAKKVLAENIRQQAHKEQKFVDDATVLANQISANILTFKVKTKGDKIYGSITTANVAEVLKEKGFSIEKKHITLENIKALGEFEASVKIYKAVKAIVKIVVESETAPVAAE